MKEANHTLTSTVIMSTYNGEKWILEQLNSIIEQSVEVDEVIIGDDCSSDSTVEIITSFIKVNNLSLKWKLIKNTENIGWKKNFRRLMRIAHGDVIFLCDQDDRWYSNKVEKMMRCFDELRVKLVVSDFVLVGNNKYTHNKQFHPSLGREEISFVPCDIHFKDMRRPGCTYAFRRSLVNVVDLFWSENSAHDVGIWIAACVTDGLYSINEPLIEFRRHENNNSPTNVKILRRRIEILENHYRAAETVILNAHKLEISKNNLEQIKKSYTFFEKRLESVKEPSFIKFCLMLKYINYYPKPNAIIGDILSVLRGK